jgi:hypothetical protein
MHTSNLRPAKKNERNDLTIMLGMNACVSGAGALGGAISMTTLETVTVPQFFVSLAFGLVVSVSILSIVWYGGRVFIRKFVHEERLSTPIAWKKALPISQIFLLTSFVSSGVVGASLTRWMIRGMLLS